MNMLDNFELKYPMKIIRIENRGIAFARNSGIYESEGDILIFHDSDMIASRDFIKNHLELHNEPDIVVCLLLAKDIHFYYGFPLPEG